VAPARDGSSEVDQGEKAKREESGIVASLQRIAKQHGIADPQDGRGFHPMSRRGRFAKTKSWR
jgi:hypothetical protein